MASRLNAPPISNTRFFHAHSKLQPIREENFDRGFSPDVPREFELNQDIFEDDQKQLDGEGEAPVFDWEEEKTLVAALLQDEYAYLRVYTHIR